MYSDLDYDLAKDIQVSVREEKIKKHKTLMSIYSTSSLSQTRERQHYTVISYYTTKPTTHFCMATNFYAGLPVLLKHTIFYCLVRFLSYRF